jgi:hypothetical protein
MSHRDTSPRRRCACPQSPETRATWALKIVERPSRVGFRRGCRCNAGAGAGPRSNSSSRQGKQQAARDHSTQGKGKTTQVKARQGHSSRSGRQSLGCRKTDLSTSSARPPHRRPPPLLHQCLRPIQPSRCTRSYERTHTHTHTHTHTRTHTHAPHHTTPHSPIEATLAASCFARQPLDI